MKKVLGIAVLLLVVAAVTALLSKDPETGSYTFLSAYNLENLLQRIGMFGVLSIAAAFVIVTGGIAEPHGLVAGELPHHAPVEQQPAERHHERLQAQADDQ